MIDNHLVPDENIQTNIENRPYVRLGGVSLFPIPFTGGEYYLTNKRVIKRAKSVGGRQVKDVPLDEVITVDYERKMSMVPIAVGILLSVLVFFLGAFLGLRESTIWVVLIPGLLGVLYTFLTRRSRFVVQTSNPEASITFPANRNNEQAQRFIQEVREAVDQAE